MIDIASCENQNLTDGTVETVRPKSFAVLAWIWCVLPDPSSEKPQLLLCLAVMNMLLLGSLMTRSSLYLQFQRPWSSWRTWKSNPAPTRNHSLPSEWKGQMKLSTSLHRLWLLQHTTYISIYILHSVIHIFYIILHIRIRIDCKLWLEYSDLFPLTPDPFIRGTIYPTPPCIWQNVTSRTLPQSVWWRCWWLWLIIVLFRCLIWMRNTFPIA